MKRRMKPEKPRLRIHANDVGRGENDVSIDEFAFGISLVASVIQKAQERGYGIDITIKTIKSKQDTR